MTTALWFWFAAIVVFSVLAAVFARMADRPGDDFGAVVPAGLCFVMAILSLLVWLVLLAIHKWPWW